MGILPRCEEPGENLHCIQVVLANANVFASKEQANSSSKKPSPPTCRTSGTLLASILTFPAHYMSPSGVVVSSSSLKVCISGRTQIVRASKTRATPVYFWMLVLLS